MKKKILISILLISHIDNKVVPTVQIHNGPTQNLLKINNKTNYVISTNTKKIIIFCAFFLIINIFKTFIYSSQSIDKLPPKLPNPESHESSNNLKVSEYDQVISCIYFIKEILKQILKELETTFNKLKYTANIEKHPQILRLIFLLPNILDIYAHSHVNDCADNQKISHLLEHYTDDVISAIQIDIIIKIKDIIDHIIKHNIDIIFQEQSVISFFNNHCLRFQFSRDLRDGLAILLKTKFSCNKVK